MVAINAIIAVIIMDPVPGSRYAYAYVGKSEQAIIITMFFIILDIIF